MRIFDKLKNILNGFVITGALFLFIGNDILSFMKSFFLRYKREFILLLLTLIFILPLIICFKFEWKLPGILIIYDLLLGLVFFGMVISAADRREYEKNGGYNDNYNYGYQDPNSTFNTNFYSDPATLEKRKNGGITNKEVKIRKNLIRKKLENKKIIKSIKKEKVTINL